MNTARERRHFRPDIQGLRAVAVVLVVLDHAFRAPAGGFVGVDVFYVISGFLITGLLLRELDKSGSISLRAFYARRVRRIVPVAMLVLVVTTVAAFLFWYVPRALQVALDAISAAFFVANWHFMATGADYLQADGPVSPVQHYWSLSIEEQFYAVWPLALLALSFILKTRRELVIVIVFGLLGSLVIAWRLTSSDPTPAYFNTFARVWELLGGALLAAVGTAAAKASVRVRQGVSAIGLILIIGSAILIDGTWKVPFPWVAPAVLGSMLVIWAAAPAGKLSVLGNPVSQWLGNISYSLYLWHFPVLIFGAAIFGDTIWVAVLSIPVMLVLAHLSYRFVERPIMKSGFLGKAARATNRRRVEFRDVAVGACALALIVGLSVAQLKGPELIRSSTYFASRFLDFEDFDTSVAPIQLSDREELVREAESATAWPSSVANELDQLTDKQQAEAMLTYSPGCRNTVFGKQEPMRCTVRDEGDRSALVLGDSVAVSWVPAVEYVADARDWSLSAIGFSSCSMFDVPVRNRTDSPGFSKACASKRELMFELVEEERPDVVILSASETVMKYTDLPLDEAETAWREGVSRTLERLNRVDEVYIITNPPLSEQPLDCAVRLTGPENCVSPVTADYKAKARAEAAAVSMHPNARLVDVESWFCSDGRCPVFVGSHVLKTDTSHLTAAAGAAVGPLLEAATSSSSSD